MRHASGKWCITSSYSKTCVFVRPHVNEWPAFSKIFTLESVFEKMRDSVIVFAEYKWTVGESVRLRVTDKMTPLLLIKKSRMAGFSTGF